MKLPDVLNIITEVNGIAQNSRLQLSERLSVLLANTYILYLKTQKFHWNIEGTQFEQLHDIFQDQYEELREAIDEIAERIRALGYYAPGSFAEFLRLSTIKESEGLFGEASYMIKEIAIDNEHISEYARGLSKLAEESDDIATIDIATKRNQRHEKVLWMMRSFLK